MIDLDIRRQLFAEEIDACIGIKTAALIEALATVAREAYLPPGPWTIRGEGDIGVGVVPRRTLDADPRHVYHNVAIGIEPGRQLFNGGPTALVATIDALRLAAGHRVLHVGCGLGYYTALIAHIVGASGHVSAIEVDAALAVRAAGNLAAMPWVDVRHGDGREPIDPPLDAILVNAGVTHPQAAWLDALAIGGRLVLPLTVTSPQMGPIAKGALLLLEKRGDGAFDVRMLNLVAIYAAIGLRDEAINTAIGERLRQTPFVPAKRLRRDAHEQSASCWLHTDTFCFALD